MNSQPDKAQLVVFVGEHKLALPISEVKEVLEVSSQQMEQVPLAPAFVTGAVVHHGQLVVFLHPSLILDTDIQQHQLPLAVVLDHKEGQIAVLVSKIAGVVGLEAEGGSEPQEYKLFKKILQLDTSKTQAPPLDASDAVTVTVKRVLQSLNEHFFTYSPHHTHHSPAS